LHAGVVSGTPVSNRKRPEPGRKNLCRPSVYDRRTQYRQVYSEEPEASMSIFGKPMSQLSTGDLQELLQEQAVENVRLEFKLEVPDKDETLKKLSSFGNTFGGFMVIGAQARSVDGRISSLPGVDVQAGYKQKIVQWCFDGASPPLTVEVSDAIAAPAGGGKVCYVIHTPESDVAPHFLNGRKGVYVRTDEFSARFETRLADESELRNLLDRRKLILERRQALLERAKKRFDTYAARTRTDRGGNRTKMGSLLELSVVPRFPARPNCEEGNLKNLLLANTISWRQSIFPRVTNGIISQRESTIVLNAVNVTSIFEANIWGLLFFCTKIDGDHSGGFGIHLYELVGLILVFIRQAEKMLGSMGYSGPIVIETALTSLLKVQWLHAPAGIGGGIVATKQGSELDDDVAFRITSTRDALREKPDGIAMEMLQYIFFSVNWPDLIDSQQKLEELVRKGYSFNLWQQPDNLMV
jgi:hypothetical protein